MQSKLLQFWGLHPKAKLSLYSIGGTLNSSRSELRNAVLALTEKGLLIAQQNGNGLTTYALANQPLEEYIGELAESD